MRTGHASAIKGLSIAVIVIAALGIVGAIVSGVLLGFSSAIINELGPSAISSAHEYGYHHGLEYELDISDQQAASVVAMMMATIGGAVSIWVLICHAVILIAGIIGLRNCSDPTKLSQTFVWAIVGAVASLLGGGFITMILLIIVAVFANSDKKLYAGTGAAAAAVPTAAYAPAAQPAQAVPVAQPQPAAAPAQPAAQPAAQPVAQPMQPAQAAQPVQPVQPIQQPVQSAPAEQTQPGQTGQPGAPLQ